MMKPPLAPQKTPYVIEYFSKRISGMIHANICSTITARCNKNHQQHPDNSYFPDDYRDQGRNKEMTMKTVVSLFSTVGFVILSGLLMATGSATASTPDGETPANEGVCDILHGGTPGLYGLCVAYCEAQDLDTVDKNPPNEKILANYNKKKQDGDPDMPCIKVPCPCWTNDELAAAIVDGTVSACISSGETIQLVDDSAALRFFRSDQTSRCAYVDFNSAPPIVRNQNISEADAVNCHSQLAQACADTGH